MVKPRVRSQGEALGSPAKALNGASGEAVKSRQMAAVRPASLESGCPNIGFSQCHRKNIGLIGCERYNVKTVKSRFKT